MVRHEWVCDEIFLGLEMSISPESRNSKSVFRFFFPFVKEGKVPMTSALCRRRLCMTLRRSYWSALPHETVLDLREVVGLASAHFPNDIVHVLL